MPEYSTTTITPSGSVKVPAMNGATPGNFDLDALKAFVNTGMMPEYDTDDSVWDTAPTSGSVNAVTSGGVHTAIASETADRLLHQTITDRRLENLEQIAGEYVQTDLQDYSSVPTGKATYALVETLKGVSRVENQLVQNWDFADGTTGWDGYQCNLSVSDNVCTATYSGYQAYMNIYRNDCTITSGHVYLYFAKVKATSGKTLYFSSLNNSPDYTANGNWQTITYVESVASTTSGYPRVAMKSPTSGDSFDCDFLNVVDLNIYFNTSNLSFLGATDSAKLATIQQNYPELLEPRAYNTGEIVDATYTKVESVGVNIFDGVMESGKINSSGQNEADANSVRSKNMIPVRPSTNYYFTQPMHIFEYDANGDLVLDVGDYSTAWNYTTQASTHYMRFYWDKTLIDQDHIQICLNSYADKTTYHPYMTDQLSIPSVTLKGAGSVHDELDVESGVITRRIGSVAMNTLPFEYFEALAARGVFPFQISGWKVGGEVLCARYIHIKGSDWDQDNMTIVSLTNGNPNLRIRNTSCTTVDAIRSAVSDMVLYYELATPTTDSVSPTLDNTLRTEGGGTVFTDADVDGQFTLGFLNL